MTQFARTALLFASLTPLLGAAPPQEITVDCDGGGDLARALDHASRVAGSTVKVSGTCIGNFIMSGEAVTVTGDGTETTTLVGTSQHLPVLELASGGQLTVRHMTIRKGYMGILVRTGREGAVVSDCIIRENGGGVLADDGSRVYVEHSVLEANQFGVEARFSSEAQLLGCTVQDNEFVGVSADSNSRVVVSATDIARNVFGVIIAGHSRAEVTGGTLTDHQSHVSLFGSEALVLSTIGVDGEADPRAVVVNGSRLHAGATIHGGILAFNDSYVDLITAQVAGALDLRTFSDAEIGYGSIIAGGVTCTGGADAFCQPYATAVTSGCSSAPARCAPPRAGIAPDDPAPEIRAAPSMIERFPSRR